MNVPRGVPNQTCNEPGAVGSYGASLGTHDGTSAFYGGDGADGMFSGYEGFLGQVNCVKLRDVTDGTTNTIMAGEFNYQMEDYLWNATSCAALAGDVRWGLARWAPAYPGVSLGTTEGDFNVNLAANLTTWRSDHPGGAQFLLADGSVQFVSESVDADLLDNLAARADGEIVGEF